MRDDLPHVEDDLEELMEEGADEATTEGPLNVKWVVANRHFDQCRAGDTLVVDLKDPYWANQVKAGNISLVGDD